MKTFIKIFTILCIAILLNTNVHATIRTITTKYHKSCFIGCSSVEVTRTSATITHGDGTKESVILRTVDCRGIGFNGCPDLAVMFSGNNPNWIESANEILFDYAFSAIANGNHSGTYHQTFFNEDTGKTITLYVDWSASFNELGEKTAENIEIYYLN